MAELLGDEAKRLLYGVKGLEIPGHSARVFPINAIGYATNTRGGSHHDHRPTFRSVPPEDPLHRELELQIKFVIDTQNFTAIGDSMTMCRFVMEQGFGIRLNEDHLRLINAVTGWGLSLDELTGMAERIVTMERLFNCREGFDRSKDTLPHRVMEEPVPDGPAKGRYFPRPMLDLALSKYYELRGWDERGVPSRFLLERLALGAHHLAGMPQNGQFGTAVA
jgi:aldehyde:ferredoxin oxidoreductase